MVNLIGYAPGLTKKKIWSLHIAFCMPSKTELYSNTIHHTWSPYLYIKKLSHAASVYLWWHWVEFANMISYLMDCLLNFRIHWADQHATSVILHIVILEFSYIHLLQSKRSYWSESYMSQVPASTNEMYYERSPWLVRRFGMHCTALCFGNDPINHIQIENIIVINRI